ncbi:Trehalose synthase [Nitrospira sp. KM1]|uniref:glycosyltransferase n=1 Tax=Nitrospira sp. KM1 TaxID=1936990 RepID=UPI0013A7A8EA|nr:glycosyltransferase [Nitrospira sp. KM1]BCA55607.1 Trehalose synthase [Nitrospira sp. KM1]
MARELDEYRDCAPKGTVDFLYRLSDVVSGRKFLHVSAVRYGSGMAEILRRLVPMMKALGVDARWEVLAGDQEFFRVTRLLANALQSQDERLTDQMQEVYLRINQRNAMALDLDADLVMVHDPQPAALIEYRKGGNWFWRCYLDVGTPRQHAWNFLRRFVVAYDAAIFSLPGFAHRLPIPQFLIYPSIDPLSEKNRELSRAEINDVMQRLGIPRNKPILLQLSRFERFKDPVGAITAYRLVKKHHDCRVIIAGSGVTHEPEGEAVLAEIQEAAAEDPDIHVLQLPPEADLEINALQRAATLIFQKSVKEGFNVSVAEAMWKGKPVIGSTAGGIAAQIIDGTTGYTVHSVEGVAFRARYLLNNPGVIQRMGGAGREHVRRNFLITRDVSDFLTLMRLFANR